MNPLEQQGNPQFLATYSIFTLENNKTEYLEFVNCSSLF